MRMVGSSGKGFNVCPACRAQNSWYQSPALYLLKNGGVSGSEIT
jgi:hypothetical protein